MEQEGNSDTSFNCCTRNNPQIIDNWTGRFSGLLSGTSLGGLGLFLASVSTYVLINGLKDFDFRSLYSPKFPCQPQG